MNDQYLTKIGSTGNIKKRCKELKDEFGSMTIINIFECARNDAFEKWLHNHRDISKFAYKEEIHNGRKSNEVFLLTDEQLTKTINIAKVNNYRFRCDSHAEEALNIQRLRLELDREKLEKEKNIYNDQSKFTPAKGNKVQRYSEDGKTLIKTYSGAIEAERDSEIDSPSRPMINEEEKNNLRNKNCQF